LTVSVRVLAKGSNLGRALGFGEFLNGNFVGGGPTLDFEGVALGLEGFQEGGAALDSGTVVGVGRRGGSELGLVAAQAGVEAGDLLVKVAPGGVDDAGCARNLLAAVFHKSINVREFASEWKRRFSTRPCAMSPHCETANCDKLFSGPPTQT